jgi:hypothetical protein
MAPASSTSGGAHGVLSHAMSPVCETTFDLCAPAQQSAPTFSLCHLAVSSRCDSLLAKRHIHLLLRRVRLDDRP